MARKTNRKRRIPLRDDGRSKRKSCGFCKNDIAQVDYKEHDVLKLFLSERHKIKGQRNTGLCRRHQAQLATAVKRAREVALLPYVGA